eukprot:1123726-Pelagomonas_calceolata.AAC.1
MAGYEDYGEEFYPEDEFYGGEVGRCDNVEIMRDLEEWSSGMWVGVLVCVPGSAANSYVFCVAKEGLQLPGALHGMKGMALEVRRIMPRNTRYCSHAAHAHKHMQLGLFNCVESTHSARSRTPALHGSLPDPAGMCFGGTCPSAASARCLPHGTGGRQGLHPSIIRASEAMMAMMMQAMMMQGGLMGGDGMGAEYDDLGEEGYYEEG